MGSACCFTSSPRLRTQWRPAAWWKEQSQALQQDFFLAGTVVCWMWCELRFVDQCSLVRLQSLALFLVCWSAAEPVYRQGCVAVCSGRGIGPGS